MLLYWKSDQYGINLGPQLQAKVSLGNLCLDENLVIGAFTEAVFMLVALVLYVHLLSFSGGCCMMCNLLEKVAGSGRGPKSLISYRLLAGKKACFLLRFSSEITVVYDCIVFKQKMNISRSVPLVFFICCCIKDCVCLVD